MTIGNQPTDDIDKTIDGGAVPGMFDRRDVLQLVNNRLNNGAATQEQLIAQRHQAMLHVSLELGDQLKPGLLPSLLSQFLRHVPPVAKHLTEQVLEEVRDRFTVIGVARGEDDVQQCPLLIDDQM